MAPREILLMIYLSGCSVSDLAERRIRIPFSAAMAAIGLAERMMSGNVPASAIFSLLPGAAVTVLGVLSRGAVGIGDGIAVMTCGFFLGVRQIAAGAGAGLVFSAAASGILLLRGGRAKDRIPFLPFLEAGMLAAVIYGG